MTNIINIIIDWLMELVMFVYPEISIAPEVLLNIDKYFSIAIDFLKQVNFIVPIPLIFMVLTIQISFKTACVVLWIINWIIKRVFDVIP